MKALVYEAPRQMVLREVESPIPDEDEVLIEVAFSGICGSELSGYLGKNSLRNPPLIFGHEFSGHVIALGDCDAALQRGIRLGTRVTANPLVTCGSCRYCRQGSDQLCVDRKLLSAALPGSNAAYVKVPVRCVHPLPDHVSLEQGALTEPIACAVHAVDLGRVSSETVALIVGMGPIGLFIVQVLRAKGVQRIIVADTNSERLEYARTIGAETIQPIEVDLVEAVKSITNREGVSVAFDAVGSSVTRNACVHSVMPGGTVIMVGLHEADSPLPINHMIRNEIQCIGSFAYNTSHFEQALRWISEGKTGLNKGIVTAPLIEGALWYERLLTQPGAITKVLLSPS